MKEIRTFKPKQVFFEDVEVGNELPPVVKKYTLMKMAAFAGVHGDWCPGHYDYKVCNDYGLKAPVAYGMQITAYASQVLTDWIGPNGVLKKFMSQTRAFIYVHDEITFKGKVLKKYVEDGKHFVDLELWGEKQDGALAQSGTGTVILPSMDS
ncbi:MAG: MaoC/PaaZ C-terminal domain-containing protein [Pseudomonadota bacterium]